MTEERCQATIWVYDSDGLVRDVRKLCDKPSKAVRGVGKIPVCGVHLRAKSVYRYHEVTTL